MNRPCDACGAVYAAQRPQSRFCSPLCRQRAQRNPRLVKATTEAASPAESRQPGIVEQSTAVRIAELQVEYEPQAAVALVLARRLDSDAETGAAVASLARQHALTLEDLERRGLRTGDVVDEIAERMRRKTGG